MNTASSRITKIDGGYPTSQKKSVICKMKPPSYFPCKINILWAVPFLQNRDDMKSQNFIKPVMCCTWNNPLNCTIRTSTKNSDSR